MDYVLRATKRCLVDDLGFSEEAAAGPLEDLAGSDAVLEAFLDKRGQHPEGQETIQGLTSRIVAYSLHSGEYRGITWYQEKAGVVWLLAAGFHRSGKPDDAYPYFLRLDTEDRLLPTSEDVQLHVACQTKDFARALIVAVPAIIEQVRAKPGAVVSGRLAGRIDLRAVWEDDDPPMLTIAFSQRLHPGQLHVPGDWLMVVAAAFFPNSDPSQLSFAWDMAGRPLRPDEIAFCDYVPRV